jgi:hypothetical protein
MLNLQKMELKSQNFLSKVLSKLLDTLIGG